MDMVHLVKDGKPACGKWTPNAIKVYTKDRTKATCPECIQSDATPEEKQAYLISKTAAEML